MKVYLAGPLFNIGERAFNLTLTEEIEVLGYDVFLPQRDGIELDSDLFQKLSPGELVATIFDKDRKEVYSADVFLFVLDGRVPDEGACVELGLAYAQREFSGKEKIILGLHTDARGGFPTAKLNAMIEGALDRVFESQEELLEYLGELMKSI